MQIRVSVGLGSRSTWRTVGADARADDRAGAEATICIMIHLPATRRRPRSEQPGLEAGLPAAGWAVTALNGGHRFTCLSLIRHLRLSPSPGRLGVPASLGVTGSYHRDRGHGHGPALSGSGLMISHAGNSAVVPAAAAAVLSLTRGRARAAGVCDCVASELQVSPPRPGRAPSPGGQGLDRAART